MKFLLIPYSSFLCSVTLCKSRTDERWCDFKNDRMKIICKEAHFEGLGKPMKNFVLSLLGFNSDSPELPHCFVLFSFRTLNILCIIYSQPHSRFYTVNKLWVLCAKFHKINAYWRWVESVKGKFHSINNMRISMKFYIESV